MSAINSASINSIQCGIEVVYNIYNVTLCKVCIVSCDYLSRPTLV